MIAKENLNKVVKSFKRTTLRATLYRYVNLSYLATLNSTIGAYQGENRYTRPKLSEAFYAASAPDLAMLEATRQYQRDFTTPRFPSHVVMPMTVKLFNVLDATDEENYSYLETSFMELTGDWRTALRMGQRVVTQDLGEAAFLAGFTGIKYPSAYRGDEWNVVIFTENMSSEEIAELEIPQDVIDSMAILTAIRDVKDSGVRKKIRVQGVRLVISN